MQDYPSSLLLWKSEGKKKEKNTGHVIKPVINVSTIYEI